ncbi:hypothetical protein TRVL_09252 [Trypanosoma vivax]|nr:hypothetical protein TRVL_09252 [Trypanosoma vivax]
MRVSLPTQVSGFGRWAHALSKLTVRPPPKVVRHVNFAKCILPAQSIASRGHLARTWGRVFPPNSKHVYIKNKSVSVPQSRFCHKRSDHTRRALTRSHRHRFASTPRLNGLTALETNTGASQT